MSGKTVDIGIAGQRLGARDELSACAVIQRRRDGEGNHEDSTNANCKKTSPQPTKTYKFEYLKRRENHAPSAVGNFSRMTRKGRFETALGHIANAKPQPVEKRTRSEAS
jgi:hypothetical protein